jgi:hypothetical protein
MLVFNKNNPISALEMQEIIQKLIDHGYGEYVDCLLSNEAICYTKKSRLNKSATCREMGKKNKELEDAIKQMKELLRNEFPDYFVD